MDLRNFYQRLREVEASIASEHVVMVSEATADGGKAGVLTEVSRANAAKLIIELRARLATDEEDESYRKQQQENAAMADPGSYVTLISEPEMRKLRVKMPPQKG